MKTSFPQHPGTVLKNYCSSDITQVDLAETHLGISRKHFNQILNGHKPISVEVAIRFSKAFNTSAQFWLNLQNQFDLANFNFKTIKVKPVPTAK